MRLLAAILLASGLLAACDSGSGPFPTPDPEPDPGPEAGLFDDSALLPDRSAPDADAWHWVDEPGMRCRNGSATGFGLRRAEGSRDLLVYLQGGGACFDLLSCSQNPNAYGEGTFRGFAGGIGQRGLFDRGADSNPFQDWNVVFVPYCTGDLHGGHAPDRPVPGIEFLGPQQFVGAANLGAVLDRLGGPARAADRVMLTGESAGGLGTLLTYGLVAERVAPAPVDLLNDSGPFPVTDGALPPARQQQWVSLWNLTPSLPADCAACQEADGLENILPHYATANPERRFGQIAFRQDFVLRFYYGYYGVIGPDTFEAGVLSIRPTLPANAGTYVIPGDGHTILSQEAFATTTIDGVALTDWVDGLLDGTVRHVPSAP